MQNAEVEQILKIFGVIYSMIELIPSKDRFNVAAEEAKPSS